MSKKGKKGKKKIAGLMLFLGWMIFILLAVVFYFYFFSDLDLRMFNKDKATQTDAQQTNQTGFSYETNANLDINSLIIECSVGGLRSGQAEDLCYRSKPVR